MARRFKYNDRVRQTDASLASAPASARERGRMTARVVGYPYSDSDIVEVIVDGDAFTSIWQDKHFEAHEVASGGES